MRIELTTIRNSYVIWIELFKELHVLLSTQCKRFQLRSKPKILFDKILIMLHDHNIFKEKNVYFNYKLLYLIILFMLKMYLQFNYYQ